MNYRDRSVVLGWLSAFALSVSIGTLAASEIGSHASRESAAPLRLEIDIS